VEPYEPHLALLTALAVGVLIGLEREQAKDKGPGGAFAGIRTYPIFSLIGAVAMLLESASIWLPLIALGGVIALVVVHYSNDVKRDAAHGVTTEVSVIATYLLGALAASRGVVEPMTTRLLMVAGLGVILTFLLSSKDWLHGIAGRVSRDDFYSTVKFLIAAVIILPLLPNQELGPLDAINPFTVGLMVVMISGLSFVGYVAMRLLGKGRGVILSAAVGGLVSSTAVTISFSGRTKEDPSLAPAAAGAIAIASTIMLARVGVLVALINPNLLGKLVIPLGAATAGAIIGGVLMYRRAEETKVEDVGVKNPFELGTAIRFGLVFALILFAIKAAKHYLGDAGLYLAAALGGTTDVDAVTLSTAKHATAGETAAVIAIMIATVSNTIVKSSLALGIGGARLGKRAFVIGGLIVAGAVAGSIPVLAL
jgi:uncharacterized membrane protein (DUF4010 family)